MRARTREGLERHVGVAQALSRSTSEANNDVCLGSHFLALPYFFAQAHIRFLGIGVRPVMLGATCYIASANDGAASNKLGRVCTYKLGSPATFSSIAENLTVTTSLQITSNQQLRGTAPAPVAKRVHITSGAQWTRNCAGRWRPCVEEMTRWSNDPPLSAEHAIVPATLTVSQSDPPLGLPRLAQDHFNKNLHTRKKMAGGRTVPVFGAPCEFQVVRGPAQDLQRIPRRSARTM